MTPLPPRSVLSGPPDTPVFQDFLQAALHYRSFGWSVFPIGRDKKPLLKWRDYQNRRPTDEEIGETFQRFAKAVRGVAGVLGSVSGGRPSGPEGPGVHLGCRDFDSREACLEWRGRHPGWTRVLPTAETGRGIHVFFHHTRPFFLNLGSVGDVRCDNRHYVILPPSRHPSGRHYRWVIHPTASVPILQVGDLTAMFVPAGYSSQPVTRTHLAGEARPTPADQCIRTKNDLWKGAGPGPDSLPIPVGDCVRQSLPGGPGQRNRCLFALARRLKSVYPDDCPDAIEPAVRVWFKIASPVIRTRSWTTCWSDFCRAWHRVEVPTTESPVLRVMEAAAARHVNPRAKLLAVCQAAAELTGGAFWLATRTAARMIGRSHVTASKLLKRLEGDKLIVCVKKADKRWRRAPEYVLTESGRAGMDGAFV